MPGGKDKDNPKPRWNACAAAAALYSNPSLGQAPSDVLTGAHKTLLPALCKSVSDADVLKVRVQAARALGNIPWKLEKPFGDRQTSMGPALEALCHALKTTGVGSEGLLPSVNTREGVREFNKYHDGLLGFLRGFAQKIFEAWLPEQGAPLGKTTQEEL